MPRGSEVVLASVPSPVQTEAAAKRSREGRALRGRRGKEGRQGRGCVPGDQAGDRRSLVGPVMTYRRGRLEGEAGRWGNGGSLATWCAGRSMGPQDPRKLNPWGPERRKPKTSAREENGPSTVRSGRPREDGVPRGENGRGREGSRQIRPTPGGEPRGSAGAGGAVEGGTWRTPLSAPWPTSHVACELPQPVTRLLRAGPQVWTQLALGAH